MQARLLTGVLSLGLALWSGAVTASQQPLASEIDRLSAAVEPELIQWRRHLHQNPELSNREVETAKYVVERLRSFGLQPQTGIAKTGVVAVLQGGRPGPGGRAPRGHGRSACARGNERALREPRHR